MGSYTGLDNQLVQEEWAHFQIGLLIDQAPKLLDNILSIEKLKNLKSSFLNECKRCLLPKIWPF